MSHPSGFRWFGPCGISHFFARGVQIAMRLALDEIELGTTAGDDCRRCQGWKLFVPPPTDVVVQTCPWRWLVPRADCLQDSLHFPTGIVNNCLLRAVNARRQQFRSGRGRIALNSLVYLGRVVSSSCGVGRQSTRTWQDATLQTFQDPRKRPAVPREPLPREVLEHQPEGVLELDQERLLRESQKRPTQQSTSDHCWMRTVMERDSGASVRGFARGEIPIEVLQALRIGRVTTLQKTHRRSAGDRCRLLPAHQFNNWVLQWSPPQRLFNLHCPQRRAVSALLMLHKLLQT